MTMSFFRRRKFNKLILRFLFAAAISTLLGACASQKDPNSTTNGADDSSLPWNRPASWEGPGVLGSQMQQAQGGAGGPFH